MTELESKLGKKYFKRFIIIIFLMSLLFRGLGSNAIQVNIVHWSLHENRINIPKIVTEFYI